MEACRVVGRVGVWLRLERGEEECRTLPPLMKIRVRGALCRQVALEAFALELEGVDFALTCGRGVGVPPATLGVAVGAGEKELRALF